MSFKRIFIYPILIGFLFTCRAGSQTLSQLLAENNKIAGLEQYKDDENAFRLKLYNLKEINKSREQYGLKPVELDVYASRLANMHCQDMLEYKYGGHWDSQGRKPYQRWAQYGGIDHISENVFLLEEYKMVMGKKHYLYSIPSDIPAYMTKGHAEFMAEKPPYDGHKKTILEPYHNYVGIGYGVGWGGFRYVQEFLDIYIVLQDLRKVVSQGSKIELKGYTMNPEYGPYGAVAYYDGYPQKLRNIQEQPNKYQDYGESFHQSVASWQLKYDSQTRLFSIPISFEKAKKGFYYIIIYVKKDINSIPYNPIGRERWGTEYAIPVTSLEIEVK